MPTNNAKCHRLATEYTNGVATHVDIRLHQGRFSSSSAIKTTLTAVYRRLNLSMSVLCCPHVAKAKLNNKPSCKNCLKHYILFNYVITQN